MSEINLRKKLCRNFCPYYKPSKKEELSCKGFQIIERLINKGLEIPFRKSDRPLDTATERTLIQHMCVVCPFYIKDCDFTMQYSIDKKKVSPQTCSPCGGFIFLGHLIESNIITIDNIDDVR
jgi:hypothetical protein